MERHDCEIRDKLQAVNKLIECAVERHDCEIRDKLQAVNKLIELQWNAMTVRFVISYKQ